DSVKGTDEKQRIAQETIAGARSHKRTAIIVVNYESAWLEPFGSWALTTAWGLVIADELHRAKRPSGRIARFMAKLGLRALFRLGLSGTPVPHSFLDLWAQLEFLDPTIFNETYTSHKWRYAIWGGFHGKQVVGWRNLEDFNRRFYSIAIRFKAADVLDLPP